MSTDPTPVPPWLNRIVRSGYEPPDQLLANPMNFRIHPWYQQQVMRSVLARLGWLRRVIVNDTTGHLLNGHLRVLVALSDNEPLVPVDYCELTEQEEAAVLATFDPIGLLAENVPEDLAALIEQVRAEQGPDLSDQLAELRAHLLNDGPEEVDHIARGAELEDLADTQIRLVYLQYPAAVYPGVIAKLDQAMVAFGVDSHAAALFALVERAALEPSQ